MFWCGNIIRMYRSFGPLLSARVCPVTYVSVEQPNNYHSRIAAVCLSGVCAHIVFRRMMHCASSLRLWISVEACRSGAQAGTVGGCAVFVGSPASLLLP